MGLELGVDSVTTLVGEDRRLDHSPVGRGDESCPEQAARHSLRFEIVEDALEALPPETEREPGQIRVRVLRGPINVAEGLLGHSRVGSSLRAPTPARVNSPSTRRQVAVGSYRKRF